MTSDNSPQPPARQSESGTHMVYEVVCTYEIIAPSKAAAGRVAGKVAQTLARTGVTRSSGTDGEASLLRTTARFKRVA